MDIVTEVKLLKHQKNEYRMKVGEHEAVVICKNKREGKQRAAQAILQKLHTHLNSWGALFKLYGRGSCKTPKEKRVPFVLGTSLYLVTNPSSGIW